VKQLERELSAPDLDDQQRAVQQQVDRLPPEQRHFLLLHVNQGLNYHQISEQTGLPEQQVFRQLSGAYAQLRIWMIERERS
jgi:RNA polymerase sigma factor (sigma-70 family)